MSELYKNIVLCQKGDKKAIEYIINKISEIKEIEPAEANKVFNENFKRLIYKEK